MRKIYIAILLLLVTQMAGADFNDGVVAYTMGDYEKAYNTMMSLTETSDNGLPEYWLGVMYLKGQGVEQDYEEAGKWLRKSSEYRLPAAQYKLGGLYTQGKGVPKDYEYAYVWYSVGAAHEHTLSINAIDAARERLSEDELKEAEKLKSEFIEKYGPKQEESGNIGTEKN